MKLRLLDYADRCHYIEIPDDTEYIAGNVVSGDMILTYPVSYDTGFGTRYIDYYDGHFRFSKEHFDKFNSSVSSSDMLDKFIELENQGQG